MARKKKTLSKPETPPDVSSEINQGTDGDEVAGHAAWISPEELTAPSAPAQMELHDAARRWVPGYQERWWDGIRKHATAMGFGNGGSEEECKAVLRHWGAKV